MALAYGHLEAFKVMWAALDPQQREDFVGYHALHDRFGWSILGWAINSGSIEATDYILSLKLPEMGLTSTKPLLLNAAVSRGHIQLIRHLIDLGVDPNFAPSNMFPPLVITIRRGLLDVVKTLVEHGKADVHYVDLNGNTTVDIAEKAGQHEVASYLRSKIIGEGRSLSKDAQQFEATVQWTRPRLLGPVISSRCLSSGLIVNGNRLVITGGRGFPEGDTTGDHFVELPLSLYQATLPAVETSMAPGGASSVQALLNSWYQSPSSNTVPRNYVDQFGELQRGRPTGEGKQDAVLNIQTWSRHYSSSDVDIDSNTGLDLHYAHASVEAPGQALATKAFNKDGGISYFEITIQSLGTYGYIAIGIANASETDQAAHLGWHSSSYGFHADIGCVFHASGTGAAFSTRWKEGDVIGCGIDHVRKEVFYTLNGQWLGVSHRGIANSTAWYAAVSLQSPGEHITANFGAEPFAFNFMVPTLHFSNIQPIGHCPTPYPALDGEILVKVPFTHTPLGLGFLSLHRKSIYFIEPFRSEQDHESKMPENFEDVCNNKTTRSLSKWSNEVMLEPHYGAFSLSQFNSTAADRVLGKNMSKFATDTHLFVVTFKANLKVASTTSRTLLVEPSVWTICWQGLKLRKIDLPPLTLEPPTQFRAETFEHNLDASFLSLWTYYGDNIFCIPTSELMAAALDDTLTKTIAPLDWTLQPSLGPKPHASESARVSLKPGLISQFGGYENEAVSSITVLDTRNPKSSQWAKPRNEGIVTIAGRYTALGLTVSDTPSADDLESTSAGESRNSLSSATQLLPSLASANPASTAAETFSLYMVFGWSGTLPLFDICVAKLVFPPAPSAATSLDRLHDLTIECTDGLVTTSKILAFCRSSLLRKILTENPSASTITLADLSRAYGSDQASKIVLSAMEPLLSYWSADRVPQTVTDPSQLTLFLDAIEVLSPEHTERIRDHIFSERVIHGSTLSDDLGRCLDKQCPIPSDLLLASIASTDAAAERVPGYSYIAALRSDFFRAAVLGSFADAKLIEGSRTLPIQADFYLIKLLWEGLCTGVLPERGAERVIDLFEVAHSLQVTELANGLEDLLSNSIDEENVSMFEEIAESHYTMKLANACAAFRASKKAAAKH